MIFLCKLIVKCSFIKADERRFKQILINLLNNAVKFTDKGTITITTQQQENDLLISVEDTGAGIKENDIPKLFTEFYTAKDHQSINPNGTGIGLYLSRELARLMNGDITVSSVYKEGTKFTVRLPLEVEHKDSEWKSKSPNKSCTEVLGLSIDKINTSTGMATDQFGFSAISSVEELKHAATKGDSSADFFKEKKTVLIVDDTKLNSFILSKYIGNHSLISSEVSNGAEAIEAVKANIDKPFCLILMDINMPIMNGIEVNN